MISKPDTGDPDPLAEGECSPVPGLIRRYEDRALILATNSCFIQCSFCTRLGFVTGADHSDLTVDLDAALSYIERKPDIREVLVSGGDPLTLPLSRLEEILSRVRSIDHVRLIRVATRAPMARPERVTDELAAMLRRYGPVLVTVHFNHPEELSTDALEACEKLVDAGLPLLNQTVLLRGVNDDPTVLAELMFSLACARVRPYYLLSCDRVRGTERYWVDLIEATRIVDGLTGLLPGHAIPAFVVDLPGWEGKARIGPGCELERTEGGVLVPGSSGRRYLIPDPPDHIPIPEL